MEMNCRLEEENKEKPLLLNSSLETGLEEIEHVDKVVKKSWHDFLLRNAKENVLKCLG